MSLAGQIEQQTGKILTSDEVALIRRMEGQGASLEDALKVLELPPEEVEARLAVGYLPNGRDVIQIKPIEPVENL